MPLRLRVISTAPGSRKAGKATPAAPERSIDFDDGVGQIRIGRRADLELSLPFSPLSGVHARLVRSDQKANPPHWLLEDLGSTNGTFVAGERLQPGVKRTVTAGTQINLAEIKLIFDGPVEGSEQTQTFVRRQISDVFSPGPSTAAVPFLTAVAGISDGATTFRLEQRDHTYMFGRTRRCEFRVKTAEVSREHASFTRRADGIYVNDLGSVNGVLVNNARVSEFRLYDGDLIAIGHIKLRLFDPTETSPRQADGSPGRRTPSQSTSHGESRLAPAAHPHGGLTDQPPPVAHGEPSTTYRAELHPAIAGALAEEGGADRGRVRRHSVRVRFTQSWESSTRFRYGIVVVAASLLAVCAVAVGFALAG
jgi:pSer/pThr/pTyr-binding forkhead associated (FHA) protein